MWKLSKPVKPEPPTRLEESPGYFMTRCLPRMLKDEVLGYDVTVQTTADVNGRTYVASLEDFCDCHGPFEEASIKDCITQHGREKGWKESLHAQILEKAKLLQSVQPIGPLDL